MCDIANRAIDKIVGFENTRWRADIRPYATYAAVNHFDKRIYFPGSRSKGDYTPEDAHATLVHELGTHVLRALPFEKCGIEAMSHGMPGNTEIDEGIAKMMECAITGKYTTPGVLHYLSIGFANFKKMSFREVYEIQSLLGELTGHATASQCFDSVQRAFRGTGVLPNNKDLAYYRGSERIWKCVEEHMGSPEFLSFLFQCGKIDIFDPFQCRYSEKLQNALH